MTLWDVFSDNGKWIGRIPWLELHGRNAATRHEGFIEIMPDSFAYELAIDALLDFMDRLRTGRIPTDVTEPKVLMSMAVQAARRQR